MVSVSGVADLKPSGNSLASEHCRHQSGVVEADTGFYFKNLVNVRNIAAFYGFRLVVVVGNVVDYVLIDTGNDLQIALRALGKPGSRLHCLGLFIEIHVHIRIQKRSEGIDDSSAKVRRIDGRVLIRLDIFVDRSGIASRIRGQRNYFILILIQIVGIGYLAVAGQLHFRPFGLAGILDDDIALGGV